MSTLVATDEVLDDATVAKPYVIVSCDSHTGPDLVGTLRSYCEEALLPEFDRFVEVSANGAKKTPIPSDDYPGEVLARRQAAGRTPGIDDLDARLKDMDRSGVAAAVVFHGAQNGQDLPFAASVTSAFATFEEFRPYKSAGLHVYNRWLAEFVSASGGRLRGSAHVNEHDIESATREVEWAASNGLTAVNLPAPRNDFPTYERPEWEPFWAACAANNMVLNTHSGGGQSSIFDYTGPAAMSLFLIENNFFCRRGLWQMILSGVFERHANLKFVLTEQHADWVDDTLRDMDSAYYGLGGGLRRSLPKPPSEYWRTNCYVGASFMSNEEAHRAVREGHQAKFMWGDDYPHFEGSFPYTAESLRQSFHDIDEVTRRQILGDTAIKVYGFDQPLIESIAERIGPRPADLSDPLDAIPDDKTVSLAFRTRGKHS